MVDKQYLFWYSESNKARYKVCQFILPFSKCIIRPSHLRGALGALGRLNVDSSTDKFEVEKLKENPPKLGVLSCLEIESNRVA